MDGHSTMATVALLLSGLGLFFIGVRGLSANLVPLMGRRARALFARLLNGRLSVAINGALAGVVTQSSTAVAWIVVSFVKGGVLKDGPALLAPTWANVGTALLPLIVAVDTSIIAGIVIGVTGFAIYFRLARGDRMRNAVEAALGGGLLLYGMFVVETVIGPVREALMHLPWWESALDSPIILLLLGAGFSFIAQSSSVAAAIAVVAVAGGLLTIDEALPLIAGANFAGVLNNALLIPGETSTGRLIFFYQSLQKLGGSLLLAALAILAAWFPEAVQSIFRLFGEQADTQLAVVFLITQIFGGFFTDVLSVPARRLLFRLLPESPAETLSKPAFLLREALSDPCTALNLSLRELARLGARLPLMLDHVRNGGDLSAPKRQVLCSAGNDLAAAIKSYLAALLDGQLARHEISAVLLMDDAASNAGALHEALSDFGAAAEKVKNHPAAGPLVEATHMLVGAVADHGESLGADDPELVLILLGNKDRLMEEIRVRLALHDDMPAELQSALFSMTVLFERIVWMARRLTNDLTQVHKTLGAD